MNSKDIAKQYDLDHTKFDQFLRNNYGGYIKKETEKTGLVLSDWLHIENIINGYNQYLELLLEDKETKERRLKEEAEAAAIEAAELRAATSKMLITSGFNFDGYRIVKYSGYISGDDAIQVDRGSVGLLSSTVTNVGDALMGSLKIIRRNALQELKEAAYDLGCNAVIGVDFDYLTLDPQTANSTGGTTYLPYVFGVTANGNAVIIEKIED